jgi:hypothetical protein
MEDRQPPREFLPRPIIVDQSSVLGQKEADMLGSLRRFIVWLRERLDYMSFRIKRARAIRKAEDDDPNIYPLW